MGGRQLFGVQGLRMRFFLPVLFAGLILTASPAQGVDRTIGGAIYTDLANPLTAGLAGVTVTATGTDGTTGTFTATTAGAQGLWQMTIPEGTYIIAPCMAGKKFEHIVQGVSDGRGSIRIVVNQANLGPNQSIQFLAGNGVGNPDAERSTVTATTPVNADGVAESTITIVLRDACGNSVAGFLAAKIVVSATGTGNTITQPTVATNASGQTTAKIKSTDAGTKTITVTVTVGANQIPITDTADVTFVPVPSPAQSLVDVNPTSALVGAGVTITFTVKDSNGNPVAGYAASNIIVEVTGTSNIITQPTMNTDANGQTTATITSTKAEVKTITAKLAGSPVTDTAQVTFTHGSVSAAQSQVVANPTSAVANGTDAITITITLKDAYDNLIDGVPATIAATGTGNSITQPGDTNASGQTTGTITSTVVEQKTITVTANSVQLTSTPTVNFVSQPLLEINKTHTPDPVDPNANVAYTISYRNVGVGDATNTVITEVLPAELTYESSQGNYNPATRTITWSVGSVPVSQTWQTVTFTARVPDWQAGGRVVNSNLTIDCTQREPVTDPTPDVTNIADKQAPQVSGQIPEPNYAFASLDPMIRFHVTDRGGVRFDGGTVKIYIENDLVYDGSAESPAGQYDSTGSTQVVKGICRRTGEPNDYAFTFLPSTQFAYEQQVNVSVQVADMSGNAGTVNYSFFTQMRMFGGTKVNSDTGTAVQDNPAVATDPDGNIWIVWDQRATATSDADVYIAKLPADGNGLEPSVLIYSNSQNQANPAIAADGAGKLYVVWEQWSATDPNHHIMMASSTDGVHWVADPNTPPLRVDPAPAEPNTVVVARNPAIAVSEANQVYIAWEQTRNGGDSDIWVRSFTQGGGFVAATQITTNTANQTEPFVRVDSSGVVYVVWTDARNAGTTGTDIFLARSDVGPWTNTPLVATAGNQSNPTGWIATQLNLALVDGNDLKYTVPGMETPISILDPNEPDALPKLPTLAAVKTDGDDGAYVAWVDSRNVVGTNGDTDIYFGEGGPSFGTNILVNDDTDGVHRQTKPAIGLDATGNPFIVWVDNRNGNDDIFYAGSTEIHPYSVVPDPNDPNHLTVPGVPGLEVVIPAGALPDGIDPNDITIAEVANPPTPLPRGGFGMAYDFGPSGAVFSPPVRIRIPLADDAPVYSFYDVYRYDAGMGTWTQDGIHNHAVKVTGAGGSYLEVQVDHFTMFIASGYTVDDNGGGGGCALSPWSSASPMEFILPFAVCALVLLTCSIVSGLRRRSGGSQD